MSSVTIYPCIVCTKRVRNHHQAVECEDCKNWQHRGCGDTGISKYKYAQMKKGLVELEFKCNGCKDGTLSLPIVESSRISINDLIHIDNLRSEEDDYITTTDDAVTSTTTSEEALVNLPSVPSSVNNVTEVAETVETIPAFSIISRGTTRGKDLLVETVGYTYTIKKETDTRRYWWCSIRRKNARCKATVTQQGLEFRHGVHGHNHPADPSVVTDRQISRQVKDTAAKDILKSAMKIVEEKIDLLSPNVIYKPMPDELARKANRFRQKMLKC